ncbi:odorant receptor 49a-like [Musca autumnalis]|uniref:odorant receptor 49a-like n=1 Tax=Musca autumnalis TaxID=221902 RepID=UPI003CFB56F6
MSIPRVETPKRNSQKSFEDFCHLPNSLMRIYGRDFTAKNRDKWQIVLMRVYSVMAFCGHIYCFYFISKEVFLMTIAGIPNLALFLRLLSGFNYGLFATLKYFAFQRNIYNIQMINCRLNEIFPKTAKERIAYQVNVFFWPKWMLTVIYFYFGAVAFIVFSPLMECCIIYIIALASSGWNGAKFGYHKLYDIPYSFDHHRPFAYLLTYTIEVMHAQFVIICNVCGDIWLLCYTMQLCMHLRYLVNVLRHYKPDLEHQISDGNFITEFARKHKILLNIGDHVNRAFGLSLLLILIYTTANICCVGIYTLTQGVGRELLQYIAFLPCAIGQYYLLCYYGQELMANSGGIAIAAYNHPWYNGSTSYKKSILLIMIRSQKSMKLSANGFCPICLGVFQMIMTESYRIFAVFRHMVFDKN